MTATILRIGTNPPIPEVAAPSSVLSGTPTTKLQNYFTSSDEKFFAGVWESTVGKWRVTYTEDEFCTLISGKAVLHGDDGSRETFVAGDSFIIPSGFTGCWETVEPVRKLYAIYQR
jgi:hypothetical protein